MHTMTVRLGYIAKGDAGRSAFYAILLQLPGVACVLVSLSSDFQLRWPVQEKKGELTNVRESRLNLIDLAGSERQKDTQVCQGVSGLQWNKPYSVLEGLCFPVWRGCACCNGHWAQRSPIISSLLLCDCRLLEHDSRKPGASTSPSLH